MRRARWQLQSSGERHPCPVQRKKCQDGSHIPLQALQGHLGWLPAAVEVQGHLPGRLSGMLEAGQENSEVVSPLPLLHAGIGDHLLDVEIDGGMIYRVDLPGQILDTKLVREARQKELDFFNSKNVWALVAFEEARRMTGKPPLSQSDGWTSTRVTTATLM